jgi:hypothetical protein
MWLHTPHYTNVKAILLTGGTLTSLIGIIFSSWQTPELTNSVLSATYDMVTWATFVFFAILTLIYIFEWTKDHKTALMLERSYFRRGYEYAEAHARWIVASPLMILITFAGLILTICSIVLTATIFGI